MKILGFLVIVMVIVTGYLGFSRQQKVNSKSAVTPTQAVTTAPTEKSGEIGEPVAEFRQRITKKLFGTHVTPQNSPVQPERFRGYHTGVDVEYTDVTSDVPVMAIADGLVVTSEYASGYGGVMVIRHKNFYAIYGHLRPSSMIGTGDVKKGQQIGVLGTGYSRETDGERKHLHFGIAKTKTILGYVQNKEDLKGWLDPLSFY